MNGETAVNVIWDNGTESVCQLGTTKLRILDSGVAGSFHVNSCNVCHADKIYGTLWKCAECPDYDLCSSCYHSDKHDVTHRVYRCVRPGGVR
jgi:E3 ubiquitin-protein ligase mind-bomb